jgi:predicted RNA binding protein YcfA (HicA-like mRNA interferase family)
VTPRKYRRTVRAGNQLAVQTASNMGYLWIFFALALIMGLYAHSLQKSAFPDAGFSPGQISVSVYVSNGPARLTLKSFAYLDPQYDSLSVNVTGRKAVSDPWLLVVQCPAEPGLVSANPGVGLYSEGTTGKQQLGDVIVSHHDHRNWSGPLGCFKRNKSMVATGLVQNQDIDATLPVLEQNPSAQSAQADTPLYVERAESGQQPIKDLVEVLQPPDSKCPAPGTGPISNSANAPCYSPVSPHTTATKYIIPTKVATFETLEDISLSNDSVDSMFPPGQITSDDKIIWQGFDALSPTLSATNLSSAKKASEDVFFAGVWYGLAAGFLVPFMQGVPDALRRSRRTIGLSSKERAGRVLAALKRDGWVEARRLGSQRVLTRDGQRRVWAYRYGASLGSSAMAGIAEDYGYPVSELRRL